MLTSRVIYGNRLNHVYIDNQRYPIQQSQFDYLGHCMDSKGDFGEMSTEEHPPLLKPHTI